MTRYEHLTDEHVSRITSAITAMSGPATRSEADMLDAHLEAANTAAGLQKQVGDDYEVTYTVSKLGMPRFIVVSIKSRKASDLTYNPYEDAKPGFW